jgi:hypothetical protein
MQPGKFTGNVTDAVTQLTATTGNDNFTGNHSETITLAHVRNELHYERLARIIIKRARELIARIEKGDFRTISDGENEEEEHDAPWMLKDEDANDCSTQTPRTGIQLTKPPVTRLSRLRDCYHRVQTPYECLRFVD